MPLTRLFLKPGIDKQNTEYGAEGGWTDADYVRFRYGLPEKVGGWQRFDETPTYLIGFTSGLFSWNDLAGSPYIAVGTSRKVYVFYGGAWGDITPIRSTTLTADFSTTSGSTTVTVTDVGHGAIQGDFVTFSNVTGDPGGIPNADLNNEFEIQQVVNGNTYTILSPTQAISNASNVGTATAAYQINVGADKGYKIGRAHV